MTRAIVIGGGIAGCSSAYALAQRGIQVILIERHEKVATEASGNPLAALYPKFTSQPSSANSFTQQGFEFTLELLKNLPNSADFFNACGMLQLAFNAREHARLSAQTQHEFLDRSQASRIAGIELKHPALYIPQAGWVRPQALCNALSKHPNITVLTATAALSIQKSTEVWEVTADSSKTFTAEIVVICTANDIKAFSYCNSIPITAVRGQLNTFAQTEASAKIRTLVCSDHYLSPALNGHHVIGTSFSAEDMDSSIREADTRENLRALKEISPEIAIDIDKTSVQARVAFRSQTRDYTPLAGQLLDELQLRKHPPRYNANPSALPWLTGLFVNAGHGSKGMITAPMCGEMIASLATKNDLPISTELASKLNPSRFLLRELGLKQMAASLYKNLPNK